MIPILALILIPACHADTSSAPPEPIAQEDSKVPPIEELAQQIEDAGDPAIDAAQVSAIELIEAVHGREEIERYRQMLIGQKAAELSAQLKAEEEAAAAAKAEALAEAEATASEIESIGSKAEEAAAKEKK